MADDEMEVDVEQPKAKGSKSAKDDGKVRFEVKKVRSPRIA
jgi:hypothetical protein